MSEPAQIAELVPQDYHIDLNRVVGCCKGKHWSNSDQDWNAKLIFDSGGTLEIPANLRDILKIWKEWVTYERNKLKGSPERIGD